MTSANEEACTTIIVGSQQSDDGSMYYGRSDDSRAHKGAKFIFTPTVDNGPEEFVALDSPFKCKLGGKRLGFSAVERADLPYHWGEGGFNVLGVGMSATETIFSNEKVLKLDPYVETGIGENSVFQITLPYIHSAREGVERLGKLIEEYGSREGFGIAFLDNKEVWYLENAGGHRYLACKQPQDQYFVSGNQSRYRIYKPDDKENYYASADLVSWAVKNGLCESAEKFDFHEAYSLESMNDKTYNYPRVWALQKFFTPSVETNVEVNEFPVYQKADHPITLNEMREAFRHHYNGTEHDPYLHSNPKELYRPVSIFRTINTHILQVRPNLPKEIGCINHVAMGMADLSVFLPLYQGVMSYPEEYTHCPSHSCSKSAYWYFRKVTCLAMTDYNRMAPVVKKAYADFEAKYDAACKEMEKEYLRIAKDSRTEADHYLQEFSDMMLHEALELAKKLLDQLFTQMSVGVENVYMFHGA